MAKVKGERTNRAADIFMGGGLVMAIMLPVAGFFLGGPIGLVIGLGGAAVGATFVGTGMVLKGKALFSGFKQAMNDWPFSQPPKETGKSNAERNAGKKDAYTYNVLDHEEKVSQANQANKTQENKTKSRSLFNSKLAQLFKRGKAATQSYEQELTAFPPAPVEVRKQTITQVDTPQAKGDSKPFIRNRR